MCAAAQAQRVVGLAHSSPRMLRLPAARLRNDLPAVLIDDGARIIGFDHVYVKTVVPKNVNKVPHVLKWLLRRVLKPGQGASILRALQARRNLEMLVEPA